MNAKKLMVGFLLITAHADPKRDRAYIENADARLLFFTVHSYDQAEAYAKVLVAIGCDTIELCPGFGHEGVARVQRAIQGKVPVGVVRFDNYPLSDFHRDSF
jgi:hypothetical protein